MPPRNYKRKRAPARAGGTEDGGASDSTMAGRDKKKVRWKARQAQYAKSADGTNRDNNTKSSDDEENSETESNSQLESEAADLDKTCLAAFCSHGSVGFAYYDPLKGLLHVLEDTQETGHYDLTRMLLEQISPDYVLTSTKSEDEFIDVLRDHADSSGGLFQIRPFKEFNAKRARERLFTLSRLSDLPSEFNDPNSMEDGTSIMDGEDSTSGTRSRNAYDFMRRRQAENRGVGDPSAQRWNAATRLANFANVDGAPYCMASIGALLDHLVRERAASDYDNDGIPGLDVRDIQILSLDKVMHINTDALLSLQIFEPESHASVHSDKTKEGLSLFGILNNTRTTLGRSLLRTWLMRPSLCLDTIRARHDALACFNRADNVATATLMHTHLKGIKNMPRIVKALESGRAKLSDWQGFVKFAFHSTMLCDAITELRGAAHEVDVIKKVIEVMDVSTFKESGTKINDIIDWEESINADRICVRPHIDEELDNRKHTYHGIDSVLSSVAEQVSRTVPEHVATSLNVVYFPQLGYLICVPMRQEWQDVQGIEAVDGWTFQVRGQQIFLSDHHVYFKSQEMHDMDTHVGDLHSLIVDRELEIVQALLEDVLTHSESMMSVCDACAELDCLLSMAQVSRTNNYTRPEMVEDNMIDIIQGRHPLHELVLDAFVANGARLLGGAGVGTTPDYPTYGSEQGWNSVLLCTGSNACGKSVYMKQIALIQIMAQVGCFVPAESATLGIVDKVFTRVATRESVSKAQSAFMIDLNQVSLALRNCTERSLIVLDEFGKGTLATDGAGLFCGVLQHLLHRGPRCPKVLVATHFHDVFTDEIFDVDNWPITFCHMQVMFTSVADSTVASGSQFDSTSQTGEVVNSPFKEKITYLYRVAKGLSLDSQAAQCAAIFGIPAGIVERAQHVSNLIASHDIVQLLDEEMTEAEKKDLQDAEAVCKRFLEWDLENKEDYTTDVKTRLRWVLGGNDGRV